ncbi:chromosomal replication initiator protein DnaA [bacterium]|nr:chromosomal replication initiator protein DnaA [bacterium]|tara:strand:- start:8388 stop:9767 length:1380 start_codon:yes stop_codon:yes gene_type:complete
MNSNELWKTVLGEIELQISRPNFLTWLKQSQLVDKNDKNGVALIGLPNHFAKDWVKTRYHKLILGSLRNLDGAVKSVDYVVVNSQNAEALKKRVRKSQGGPKVSVRPQEPLLELRVDPKTNLNPRYALDSFIVGSSNELAYAAVQAVIDDVGTKYNPLFLYGGVGLGKTHLIQAAGNAIQKKYSKKVRVLYVTSEKFINDVVWALRNRRMDDVKSKYRDVDLLIIDDIQFIGGKAATEQEFFYTFNTLHEHNKQIIMSSDRPPAAIPTLEERLRSRFEGGMIIDISYPDYEMRLAILRAKVDQQEVVLEDGILEHVALKIQNNIRELEGVLNKVIFYQQYKGEKVTTRKVDEIIQEVTNVVSKNITVQDVLKTVADFFDVSPQELSDRSRKKEIVEPRQVCMYLMRDVLNLSYPHIGERLGKRDHTTAIHAYEKISREVSQNPQLNQRITLIKDRLQKA